MRRVLALLVLAVPSLARADAFVPPDDKHGVQVVIGLENAAAYPQYTFAVYRNCLNGGEHDIIEDLDDDDGAENFEPELGCDRTRLYAFPVDAFPLTGDDLPPAARAQLTDDPPTDARILWTNLDAEALWWVPDDVDLFRIRDVYRVEISGSAINLTPTRVIFDFGRGRELSKPFYKGKRPRIPRASDTPPEPPPEPAAATPTPAPSDTPPPVAAPASPAPAPASAPAPSASPAEQPAPPPVAAASTAPAPAEPSQVDKLLADFPPALLYGGGCLIVALGTGLLLRRR